MAYLDENGLQRFYNGIATQIETMAGQDGDSIQVIDTYNDGNIQFVSPSGPETGPAFYMFFYIDDNGDLIYQRTLNAEVDFYLQDGSLYVRGATNNGD